ncbi:MAG: hypothetical protein H7A25_23500 [Leptospiraceae bacterium]|nr:hypothetical protein [Leptospiraceae bacterium]MCP5502886.1 hypothetical protein [Leptospiraceae bacterium]
MTQSSYKLFYISIFIIIILEMLSPVPFLLSIGSLLILFLKPKWFLDFVITHYNLEISSDETTKN